MALLSQPAAAEDPISLPLFKLSFCTTATLQAKMLWEHLSGGSDMSAVFHHVKKPCLGGITSEKQILKLVRAGNLLVCFFRAGALLIFVPRHCHCSVANSSHP